MCNLLKSISLVLFMLIANTVLGQQKNFSGLWNLNVDKTDFGELSKNSVPIQIKIYQETDSINIERFSKNKDEEIYSYLEKMPFNGKTVNTIINKFTKKSSFIKYQSSDKTLTETGSYTNYDTKDSYKITEIWSVSNDGRTLTVNRTDESDGNSYNIKAIYEKSE